MKNLMFLVRERFLHYLWQKCNQRRSMNPLSAIYFRFKKSKILDDFLSVQKPKNIRLFIENINLHILSMLFSTLKIYQRHAKISLDQSQTGVHHQKVFEG